MCNCRKVRVWIKIALSGPTKKKSSAMWYNDAILSFSDVCAPGTVRSGMEKSVVVFVVRRIVRFNIVSQIK